MNAPHPHIVIIGAGQAAASVIGAFRKYNDASSITLIGDEGCLPYQRPPLSKQYLMGEYEAAQLQLHPESWYQSRGITLRLGDRATKIDRANQTIILTSGDQVHYDKLVLATGATPRMLPPSLMDSNISDDLIFTIRNQQDITRLSPKMKSGAHLCVIGGGYIGLEAAAVARKLGLRVTLCEGAPRILGRVACTQTADYFHALHRQHQVEIHTECQITKLTQTDQASIHVIRQDHPLIEADIVIIGIGVTANKQLALDAGIDCDEGIRVDAFGRTTDSNIFAAGDCTSFSFNGENIRLESVGNAVAQGEIVGLNLAGQETQYAPHPWFWSTQYDCNLQIAGLNRHYDAVLIRNSPDLKGKSHWYYANDRLVAVDAMNDPASYMIAKKMLELGKSIPRSLVADETSDLKAYFKQHKNPA